MIKLILYIFGGLLLFESYQAIPTSLKPPKTFRHAYNALPFQDCGSSVDLMFVQISSCSTAPCPVPINGTVTVTAEFAANDPTNVFSHEAYWIINTINTRAYVTPDACDGRNCPFQAPDGLAFAVDLKVNDNFPTIPATLHWRSSSFDQRIVVCFKVPITFKPATN